MSEEEGRYDCPEAREDAECLKERSRAGRTEEGLY